MSGAQLLLGKVAGITGGLTGIGRVGSISFPCQPPFCNNRINGYGTRIGHCPGVYPTRSICGN